MNARSYGQQLYEDPAWADQFDVILHDECFANIKEQEWMDKVLAPHRKGKPAVLLHCPARRRRLSPQHHHGLRDCSLSGHLSFVSICKPCSPPSSMWPPGAVARVPVPIDR